MRNFDIIGFPINLGCDRNGNELTPSLLRADNFYYSKSNLVNDLGDIFCPDRVDLLDKKYSDDPRIKFEKPILESCKKLCATVISSLKLNHIPIVIGGDHVLAYGSIAAVALEKGIENYAVIYIDAHGDFNTEETSSTGNMHGMHLSFLMGNGKKELVDFWGKSPLLNPKNIYFLGARALDPGEKELANELGIYIKSTEELNECDLKLLVEEIIADIKGKGIHHIHLSFDIDSIDPKFAPGTGVPEANGITPNTAYELVKFCMGSDLVQSIDIVELNVNLDIDNKTKSIFENTLRIILS